ncbi:single-stranded DNA-binding protein [Floricoccus penangensis]|uniref:Single-stranded DNA-binding protein n=1 Tax=Floricoccus penangensis TaxID=1859475 RepID=A0A9Q5JHY8_9LACT|nr:single-stranded DNA-binding protein [Floricoccus penangensis]OFI47903.1 single-stranded DNA-binding protein [Floricoccus penangensis]
MINNVVLVGRLTKDIELRQTASGQSNTSFTLAITRNFKNQNGEYDADFVQVVAWRQTAEFLARFGAKKGNLLGVTGRIQTRNYENQQGQRVYVTEVVADNVTFLESRATRESQGGSAGGGYQAPQGNSNNNSYGSSTQQNNVPDFGRNDSDPFGGGSPINIDDDDLPF